MRQFILLMLVMIPYIIHAQINATTEDGKNVILNDDGSWIYETSEVVENNSTDLILSCEDVIKNTYDKMTGETRVESNDVLVVSEDGGKTGFGIYGLRGSKKTLILITQAVGAGNCIDDDDKANFLFRDGTRMELTNMSDFNCDGTFTLYFGGIWRQLSQLETLKNKEIETLRVWTSDGYVERDFTPEQSKTLMKTLDCLAED